MDILPIEWRDEGTVELLHDPVRLLIGAILYLMRPLGIALELVEFPSELPEQCAHPSDFPV